MQCLPLEVHGEAVQVMPWYESRGPMVLQENSMIVDDDDVLQRFVRIHVRLTGAFEADPVSQVLSTDPLVSSVLELLDFFSEDPLPAQY